MVVNQTALSWKFVLKRPSHSVIQITINWNIWDVLQKHWRTVFLHKERIRQLLSCKVFFKNINSWKQLAINIVLITLQGGTGTHFSHVLNLDPPGPLLFDVIYLSTIFPWCKSWSSQWRWKSIIDLFQYDEGIDSKGFMDTHREMHPQIKFYGLWKVWIWATG